MTKQPSLLDPADDLTQILGPDLAKAFLDHRKMLKKPMTAFAGQLMAKKLRGFPDPVAAVEQSILRGWCDVFPIEPLQKTHQLNGRRMTAAEITGENLRQEIEQLYGQDGQKSGDLFPSQRLLAASRQTH